MLQTITVDVGTTSVKLCLFDDAGELLASERHATPTVADAWGEIYDIAKLTDFVGGFIRDLAPALRATTKRIAITGVGESGGLVRPDLSLASPMILWHDHRGADLIAPLDADARALVYRVTGLPVNANYGLSKTAWAVSNADGDTDDAKWLNISEYLAALMTGQFWSEYSLASRTMALDLEQGTWSPEVSALVGLDIDVYPELRAATEGSSIATGFANSVGLPTDVHVHVAGHDHMVGGIGADLQRGELLNSTGTTEGLLFLRDEPTVDDFTAASKLANGISTTGISSTTPSFTLFASIPTGGSAFATLQSMLGMTADELTTCIAEVYERYMAGEIDVRNAPLVLPQFRGSPPPTKRAAARAIISGLGTDATAADIVFGTFLGMALQFSDVLELFRQRPDRIKVIGPANRNPLWLQLKADLIGTPLSVSGFPEVVSRGAQSLASGTTGNWADCSPVDVLVDEARHQLLREWHDEVRPRWEHLKATPE
jgi:sugar (pentulose or hexulose) kinase